MTTCGERSLRTVRSSNSCRAATRRPPIVARGIARHWSESRRRSGAGRAPRRLLGEDLQRLDAASQAPRRLSQGQQLLMAWTERACLQVVLEASADLLRPAQSEALLEGAIVVDTSRAQDAPEPEPQVIHRALEL